MTKYRFTFGDPPPCDETCPAVPEYAEPLLPPATGRPRGVPAGCYDEFPAITCAEECAPVACAPKCCPPKVEKRNYIVIKPGTSSTCLTIGQGVCTPEVVAAYNNCIELRIRKRGECVVLLTMTPVSATLEGAACFTWPIEWWRLRDNWYEADVYVNGCTCLTVGLRQVGCDMALLAFMHKPQECCATPRACATPIEENPVCEPMNPVGNCEAGAC